jgi:hypothetical protein
VVLNEEVLASKEQSRRRALLTVEELLQVRGRHTAIKAEFDHNKERLQELALRKAVADIRIEQGRELARRSRDARMDVVRRVFNECSQHALARSICATCA